MVEQRGERMTIYKRTFGSMYSTKSHLRIVLAVRRAFQSALPDKLMSHLQAPLREEVQFLSLDEEETEVVGEGNQEEVEEEEGESSVKIPSPLLQEKQTDYVVPVLAHQALPMLPEILSSAPVGGCLSAFWKNWELAKIEDSLVELVKIGYKLILTEKPLLIKFPRNIALPGAPEKRRALLEIVKDLLRDNVIEVVKEESSPGYYNHFFITPKAGDRQVETYPRSESVQFPYVKRDFQNGNRRVYKEESSVGGLGYVSGSEISVSPCANTPSFKKVSSFRHEQFHIPIQSSPNGANVICKSVHQGDKRFTRVSSGEGDTSTSVPGRLVDQSQVQGSSSSTYQLGSTDGSETGVHYQLGKIGARTKATDSVFSLSLFPGQRNSSPVREALEEDRESPGFVSQQSKSPCQNLTITNRSLGFYREVGVSGNVSSATNPVIPDRSLVANLSESGRVGDHYTSCEA